MGKPLVSIQLTSYKHSKYLRRAIDSVLGQTYTNIELLISDNGSHDGSREIIESYNDNRIKCNFFSHNKGPKANVEACHTMSTGKYYAILNSDDYWDITKIEKQVDILENNPDIGAVFTHVHIIDGDDNIQNDSFYSSIFNKPNMTRGQYIHYFFFYSNFLNISSVLIHRDLFFEIYSTSAFLSYLGDYYYWTKLIKKKSLYLIQEKLTYYRTGIGNMSSLDNPKACLLHYNETYLILSDYFDDMPKGLFYDAFSNMLLKDGELSKEELVCEQILLYLRLENPAGRFLAIQKLYGLRKNKDFIRTFNEVYGFSWDDYYSLELSSCLGNAMEDVLLKVKFEKISDYLANPLYQIAIFHYDNKLTAELLNYLITEAPSRFKEICCIIYSINDVSQNKALNTENLEGVPLVTLEQALRDYNINRIIVGSYDDSNEINRILRLGNKHLTVDVKEILSIYETLMNVVSSTKI